MGKVIWLKDMGEEKMENVVSNVKTIENFFSGEEKIRNVVSDVNTIANYFLSEESMSPKKLQKICYYAYSWYLTLYDKCLFDDGKFQAWVHGPVNPKLYDKYKGYGWREIPTNDKPVLDDELKDFLETILNTFSEFNGDQLENMTHNETPWIEARVGLEPEMPSNNVISDETIKLFYSRLKEKGQVE